MLKNAFPPFQVTASASMSGTLAFTSSVSTILYHDSVSLQYNWTGNPTGNFAVEGSLDYNPGLPQSAGGQRNGTWNALSLSPTPAATTTASTSYLVNLNQLSFPYLRTTYTNSTGSGALGIWVSGKSLG